MPRGQYERKTYEVICDTCLEPFTVKQVKTKECPKCKKKRLDAESYQRNKEKIAVSGKKYREANKERIAQRDKAYRETNRDALIQRSKEYYYSNREERLKYAEEYRRAKGVKPNGLSGTEEVALEVFKEMFPDTIVLHKDRSTIKSPVTGAFLELDFYFPDLRLAIELNGITHYAPIYGIDKFERQVRNDAIKRKECSRMGITLIEIPLENGVHYERFYGERERLKTLLYEFISSQFTRLRHDKNPEECIWE